MDWLGDMQHDAMLLRARQLVHLQSSAMKAEAPSRA
jgi:hypothetical protein